MALSETFPRLFTIDEANALLGTLRPLVKRILENIERLKEKSESLVRHQLYGPNNPDLMNRLQEDEEIALLIGQIKGSVEEIHSYGCLCKGAEQGLVDFPCLLGGEVVFLCWKYGEEGIGYWHRVDDGFAGRRPLLDPEEGDPGGSTSYH